MSSKVPCLFFRASFWGCFHPVPGVPCCSHLTRHRPCFTLTSSLLWEGGWSQEYFSFIALLFFLNLSGKWWRSQEDGKRRAAERQGPAAATPALLLLLQSIPGECPRTVLPGVRGEHPQTPCWAWAPHFFIGFWESVHGTLAKPSTSPQKDRISAKSFCGPCIFISTRYYEKQCTEPFQI